MSEIAPTLLTFRALGCFVETRHTLALTAALRKGSIRHPRAVFMIGAEQPEQAQRLPGIA